MPRPSRHAVLLATETTGAALATAAQGTTRPGEALGQSTEAAGQGRTAAAAPASAPSQSRGEQLLDRAETARDAATATGASPSVTGPDAASPGVAPATAVGAHRRLVLLSSAVPSQPLMTGNEGESGSIRHIIRSPPLRFEGMVSSTGVPGVAGRTLATGAERLRGRDAAAGVPKFEASSTRAARHTTPDFAPGTAS
ncbi:MAG: hypothetical protein JNK88_01820 [Mangrovicoccus sp.]|nr:hypothetical protein [Mangrovicoccus sp.]